MMSRWPLLLALLAAGCNTGYVAQNEPPASSGCERAADEDPAVRELTMKMAGTAWWLHNYQNDMVFLRREALLKCMRQKGLIQAGGGVEPVKPVWYDPSLTGF